MAPTPICSARPGGAGARLGHGEALVGAPPARERAGEVVAVEARDDAEVDVLGARGLALAVERAAAEALLVGGGDQGLRAASALGLALRQRREVCELRADEERGG